MRGAAEAAIAVARAGLEADTPEPPPRGLLPLLRFTRLPDRALAAARKVLDDDDGFRLRVRDVTSEASVGRASWLFLDRPEGWEDEVAALVAVQERAADAAEETKAEAGLRRRVAKLESSLGREAGELARLRAELAEAKEQLAGERRARRLAESDGGRRRRETAALATEIEELRHRQSVLEAARDQSDRSPAPVVEEAVEVAIPARAVVDHVRLADLVADGARTVGALSAMLSEAERLLAPTLDPSTAWSPSGLRRAVPKGVGPGGRRPTALPPGIFDDSVEAAGHLARVEHVRVLVDGYNVTKSARPELALSEQRQWLVDAAVELALRTGARLELVFDGADDRPSAPADLGRRRGVQVRFSAEGVEADDVLLELIEGLPVDMPVVVASDDRRVRDGARRRGANVVSTAQLLSVFGRPPS